MKDKLIDNLLKENTRVVDELGKALYATVTQLPSPEGTETSIQLSQHDCIDYIYNLVVNRTYDRDVTEIKTIYAQLEKILNTKVHPAPDLWDRLYNIDFYIQVGNRYIGLQIKPAGEVSHILQIFKERNIQAESHKKFTAKFGGQVFYIISVTEGKKKRIHNLEVIEEIREEILRLSRD
jgi:hypothetical protein